MSTEIYSSAYHWNIANPISKQVYDLKLALVEDILASLDVSSILDYGCGDGRVTSTLKAETIAGYDPNPMAVIHAKEAVGAEYFYSRLTDLEGQMFDLVLALDVIEHLEDDAKFFTDIAPYLGHKGYVLIAVPTNRLIVTKKHKRHYSPTEIKSLLHLNGFDILISTGYVEIRTYLDKLMWNYNQYFPFLIKKARQCDERYAGNIMILARKRIK